jgi:hypothetical protein
MKSICQKCGHVGDAIKVKPGSTAVSVALLILGLLTMGILLIAWLAYGIWRLASTKEVCPSCQSEKTMISIQSPLGKQLLDRINNPAQAAGPHSFEATVAADSRTCPFCAETIKAAAKVCKHCGRDLAAA